VTAITTSYGRMLLCEVNCAGNPAQRLPGINAFRERCDMWILKKFDLPWLYWNVLLLG
jgi:sulfide:quinone oxidoreductase